MSKSITHWFRFVGAILVAVAIFVQTYTPTVHADGVAQSLPFAQNWSNAALITLDDDWSGVPGIIGYRGDNITSGIGVDPQTLLGEGTVTPDVNANRSDPDTFTSGGVSEFDGIPNPVVALQGSATADAPNLVISLNTSGQTNISASYNLRDIDGSADNAVQAVALQYRVGSTGNFTNIPAGFVSDATTGPNLATLVTPVNVTLPAACENQPLVQLRIITSNATGSDEWVGIDDINIGGATGPTNLAGSGLATPNNILAGNSSLLSVNVTPASTPPSTGITVSCDLSTVGGSATQQLFDDATHGDVTAGDNAFSFSEAVPAATPGAAYTFPCTIADAQARTANANIALTVNVAHDPAEHLVMGNPSDATADIANFDNYLISRTQYVESYNMDKGEPNWVSWHLDSTWIGGTPRQDDYRPDTSLPAGWYQVQQTDYQGSGFDRGHMCPSADRTSSVADNSATFLMTNFVPQAPNNNQGPWEDLESYERQLVAAGNELYVIAGPAGVGGTGSNGGITTTIAGGHVSVPAYTWKVIVVLPVGDDDLFRVAKGTRTIAVIMPNDQSIGLATTWPRFR
ncbi:MAG: DNA/RNA non-specific endonuclease, partial [Acidobacteriota bacterium]